METFIQKYQSAGSGACVALLLTSLSLTVPAQDAGASARARAEIMAKELQSSGTFTRLPQGLLNMFDETNRALIGITTTSGGNQLDTLGVLVGTVTTGGPAGKAGIKQGDRITAVNGVSLRISAADADDPELRDLGQRRLIREIGKAKVGDEVELAVLSGSKTTPLKVRTVRPEDLFPTRTVVSAKGRLDGLEKHASIGASIGSTGTVRDTLGIFISGVVSNGPAEKAGIIEGDRIAAINGVDVRVSREDADDSQVGAARVNRFTRELGKLAPSDNVTLRIYSQGKYREVQVTTGNSADSMSRGFQINTGDGIRTLSLPGMKLENMPVIIRSRSGADTNRIVYRKATPSVNRTVIRRVSGA